MKKFGFLLMAGLMALGFGACSDEVNVPQDSNEEIADAVYMSLKLELPTSRSATDEKGNTNSDANPDSEVGLEKENKVGSIKVVLASKGNDGEYEVLAESNQTTVGNGTEYTVTFQSEELEGKKGQTANVFVVCNPTTGFTGEDLFKSATLTDDDLKKSIAANSHFLMTNAKMSETTIPKDLALYNSPTKPFDLGVVEVERTAARFDYKAVNNNVYPIVDEDNKVLANVKLTHVALANMSKSYWNLRRVAPAVTDDETAYYDDTKISICEAETPKNFVVDTDAAAKLGGTAPATNFFYQTGIGKDAVINPTSEVFDYTALNDIDTEDNWIGDDSNDGYKIWRYATENTLPSIKSQVKQYSTGVIFKGVIENPDDVSEDAKLLDGTSAVYVFDNVLYGKWEQLKEAAEAINGDDKSLVNATLYVAFKNIESQIEAGKSEPSKEVAAKAGFTVYEPNEDGDYEVYYYYWNRHNDNGESNNMGIMEFAVVRNNVYKLSVTNIKKFGHPGDPTGDPDPEKPDDPDEDDEVYFRVGVKVLPWVVRVNNIEF